MLQGALSEADGCKKADIVPVADGSSNEDGGRLLPLSPSRVAQTLLCHP